MAKECVVYPNGHECDCGYAFDPDRELVTLLQRGSDLMASINEGTMGINDLSRNFVKEADALLGKIKRRKS